MHPVALEDEDLKCGTCRFKFSTLGEGIIDLRTDPFFDTLLDVDAYDAGHNVELQSNSLAEWYEKILLDCGLAPSVDHVFEIGAGSGNLTAGLVRSSFFHSVYSSDLSPAFLALLQRRVGTQPKEHLRLLLLDANQCPFADDSFDCVLGHSVLHHVANFELTVQECVRITRNGGACVFGEPVFDVAVYTALAADLILNLEVAKGEMPKERRNALRALAERPSVKLANLIGNRDDLAHIEDKFMFSIEYMKMLSERVGCSDFKCINLPGPRQLGSTCRQSIERTLRQVDSDFSFLDDYEFIFTTISRRIGENMDENGLTAFSYFVFCK